MSPRSGDTGLLLASILSVQTPTRTISLPHPGIVALEAEVPAFKARTPLEKFANAQGESTMRGDMAKFWKNFADLKGMPRVGQSYYRSGLVVDCHTPRLISAHSEVDSYLGGAHGSLTYVFMRYGMVNRRPQHLKLDDLLGTGEAGRVRVNEFVMAKLRKDEHADWVQDGQKKALDKYDLESFTVTPKSLRYLFAPYRMGSYASGPIAVDVPLAEIREAIDPKGPLGSLLG